MALQVGNNLNPVARPVVRVVPVVPAQANQAQAAATNTTAPDVNAPITPAEVKKGLGIFFKGVGVSLGIFLLVAGGLSFFPMHFVLRAFLVMAITILLFWAIDYALGNKKSNFTGPVIATIIISTIVLLLICAGKSEPSDGKISTPTVEVIEIIEITEPGKLYITKKVFHEGENITIAVTKGAYQTDGADWRKFFSPGEHAQTMTGSGNMEFVSDYPTTITITRQ